MHCHCLKGILRICGLWPRENRVIGGFTVSLLTVTVSAPIGGPGLYPMEVTSEGRTATAMLGVHPSWEWTMRKARENVLTAHQKATSHVESWYGFHSGFLAAGYFPDDSLDQAVNARFGHIMNLLYGPDMSEPKYYAWRIQNTASTIGMFTDRFEAFGNVEDLETAERLADWMIRFSQAENGAYMNGVGIGIGHGRKIIRAGIVRSCRGDGQILSGG